MVLTTYYSVSLVPLVLWVGVVFFARGGLAPA